METNELQLNLESHVSKIMGDYIRNIKVARGMNLDMLAAAFIKETNLDPRECELVEQSHADGKVTWFFRKRESHSSSCLECGAAVGAAHSDGCRKIAMAREEACDVVVGRVKHPLLVEQTMAGDVDTAVVDGKVVVKRDIAKGETIRMPIEHYEKVIHSENGKLYEAMGRPFRVSRRCRKCGKDTMLENGPDLWTFDDDDADKKFPFPCCLICFQAKHLKRSGDMADCKSFSMIGGKIVEMCTCKSLLNGHLAGCPMEKQQ